MMSEAHPSAASGVVITEHAGDDHITVVAGTTSKFVVADYLDGNDFTLFQIRNRDVLPGTTIYCYADDPMGEVGAYATATVALEPGGNPVVARLMKPGVFDGDLVVVERLGTGGSPINDALAMRLDERTFDTTLMNSLINQAETATESAITGLVANNPNLTFNWVNVDYAASIDFRANPGPNGGIDISGSAFNVGASLNYDKGLIDCDFEVTLAGTTSLTFNANLTGTTANPVNITGVDLALPYPVFNGTGLVCGLGATLMNLVTAAFAPPLIIAAAADIENLLAPVIDNWLDARISEALSGITTSAATSPFIASVAVDTMRADNNGLMVSLDVGSTTNTWHAVGSGDVTPLLSQRNTTDGSVFDLSLFISPDLFNAGMRHAVDAGVTLGATQTLTPAQGQEIVNNVVGANSGYSASGWTMAIRQDTAPRMANFGQAEPGVVLDAVVIDLAHGGEFVAQYVALIENVGVHGELGQPWNFAALLDLTNSNCNEFGTTLLCLPTVPVKFNTDAAVFNVVNPAAIFVPGGVAGSLVNAAVDMVGVDGMLPSANLFGVVALAPVSGELAGIDRFHLQFDALPPVSINTSSFLSGSTPVVPTVTANYHVQFNVSVTNATIVSVNWNNISGAGSWTSSGNSATSSTYVLCDSLPVSASQTATGTVTVSVNTADGPVQTTFPFSRTFSQNIQPHQVNACTDIP